MTRVGLVDYHGFKGLGKTIYSILISKGYEVEFRKQLSKLKNPEEFDAILMHPGVSKQIEAIDFGLSHPEVKTAIVSATTDDYFLKDEIPFIRYSSKTIIDFIEGRLKDI